MPQMNFISPLLMDIDVNSEAPVTLAYGTDIIYYTLGTEEISHEEPHRMERQRITILGETVEINDGTDVERQRTTELSSMCRNFELIVQL